MKKKILQIKRTPLREYEIERVKEVLKNTQLRSIEKFNLLTYLKSLIKDDKEKNK